MCFIELSKWKRMWKFLSATLSLFELNAEISFSMELKIWMSILSYLCHIVHIVHVRPRFCSYKRSRDYLSCSFSLIDNLPWFLLSPDYIYLNSKTLATVYLWYIWFLPGWFVQKLSVWFKFVAEEIRIRISWQATDKEARPSPYHCCT